MFRCPDCKAVDVAEPLGANKYLCSACGFDWVWVPPEPPVRSRLRASIPYSEAVMLFPAALLRHALGTGQLKATRPIVQGKRAHGLWFPRSQVMRLRGAEVLPIWERDRIIAEEHDAGVPYHKLAARFGISKGRVGQVIWRVRRIRERQERAAAREAERLGISFVHSSNTSR